MTLILYYNDGGTEENNFYHTHGIIIENFYNMELREKCIIVLRKLAMHDEQMSKWPCVSLFQILSDMFLPNKYYLNWFTIGKFTAKKFA